MATTASGLPVIRFGTFEVDQRAGELRRNGSRVKLQEQPFQVLIALLDRPGDVVTREELQKKLWPADTFVDFDHSLNAAIRRLREALGDSAENPRFVETVARRGYRFIAPVTGIAAPAELPKIEAAPRRDRKWLWAGAALLVALLAVGISVGFHIGVRASRLSPPPVERRLTANPEEAPVTGAAISPDGKYLAFSDKNGCYLRQIDTGEIHLIPLPAGFNPHPASWFPDELHLLVTWVAGPREPASLWMISIMGGEPRKLADQGRWPAVSPDGSQIVFVEQAEEGWLMPLGGEAIWLMQADGQKAHKILDNKQGEYGSAFGPPAWSPDGKRFAFVRNNYHAASEESDSQIEIMDIASGTTEVAMRSPRLVGTLAWTGDGRLIYSVMEPRPLPGDANLWAIHIDQRANRTFGEPLRLTAESGYVSSLSLSSKGDRLTILRETLQPDVYVANLQPGGRSLDTPRRLTLDERDDYPFAWTPDSKSIIFSSNRDGSYHLFKQAPDQTEPELLLGGDEQLFVPRLSPDGSQLLYMVTPKMGVAPKIGKGANDVGLMRLPLGAGPPQFVLEKENMTNQQCARLPATLCLFTTVDNFGLHFFSFDPIRGSFHEIPELAIKGLDYSKHNWSLSPDGQTLATSNREHGYTSLDPDVPVVKLTSLNGFGSRIIRVPNWASVSTLDWAVDSKSIWASAHNTNNTSALLNIGIDGQIRTMLREDKMILGWAIPSSDGRHLALWEASGTSNVWMLEKF